MSAKRLALSWVPAGRSGPWVSTLQMPSLIPRIVQGLSEKQKGELQALKIECEGLPLA